MLFEDRACGDTKFNTQACNCEKAPQIAGLEDLMSQLLRSGSKDQTVSAFNAVTEKANNPGPPHHLQSLYVTGKADLQLQGTGVEGTPTAIQELIPMECETPSITHGAKPHADMQPPQLLMHHIPNCFAGWF